jgi:hypothetical protein
MCVYICTCMCVLTWPVGVSKNRGKDRGMYVCSMYTCAHWRNEGGLGYLCTCMYVLMGSMYVCIYVCMYVFDH